MKKGFTLIELIVVIAIIAVLAAVITPNVFRAIERAQVSRVIADVNAIMTAMQSMRADTGKVRYCASGYGSEGAAPCFLHDNIAANCNCPYGGSWGSYTELTQNPGGMLGWDGPYLDAGSVRNPWGGLYSFYATTWGSWLFDNAVNGQAWLAIWLRSKPEAGIGSCGGNYENYEMPVRAAQRLADAVGDGTTDGSSNIRVQESSWRGRQVYWAQSYSAW